MAASVSSALFGGAFNPPHRSHERIVRACLTQLPVQRVLVIPSGQHPFKPNALLPGEQRMDLCRLAFADIPEVIVSNYEVQRSGPSYTVDTLRHFAKILPHPVYWVIGSDNLPQLPLWKDHHEILRLATVVTYPRLGYPLDAAALADLDLTQGERQQLLAHALTMPADNLSATSIRADLAAGHNPLHALHPRVLARIRELGLYSASS